MKGRERVKYVANWEEKMRETESGTIWGAQKMKMELLKEKGGGRWEEHGESVQSERDKHGEKVRQKEKSGEADLKKDLEQLRNKKYCQCVF